MKRSTPATERFRAVGARTPSTTVTLRKAQSQTSRRGAFISRAAAITPRKILHSSSITERDFKTRIVFLIRHGQSKGQVASEHDRRFDESLSDCGLTDVGKEQAANIANLLGTPKIDLIICSPLTRALQTALIAFPENNKIVCNYDLREVGSMIPENLPRKVPEVQADLEKWGLDVSKVDFETQNQITGQIATKPRPKLYDVTEYKLPPEVENIAVICHYHVIRTALSDPFDAKQSRDIQKNIQPKNAEPIRCILQADGRLQLPSDDEFEAKESSI